MNVLNAKAIQENCEERLVKHNKFTLEETKMMNVRESIVALLVNLSSLAALVDELQKERERENN